MQYNVTPIIFGCLICLVLVAEAQETRRKTETGNEGQAPDQAFTARPSSTSRFLEILRGPTKKGFNSARRFIRNRIDNVHHVMNMTRLRAYKIFMSIYNKTYSPQELPRRMALFFKRREEIQQSVTAYKEGKSTYFMKENVFTDWEDDELKQLIGVSVPSAKRIALVDDEDVSGGNVSMPFARIDTSSEDLDITVKAGAIPASKDWRNSGCIGAPIQQGSCGSCYAIATISVVEAMKCIKNLPNQAYILGPQQIIDCTTEKDGYAVNGCNGGYPEDVLKYLQSVDMIARDKCYPYERRKGACRLQQVRANQECVVSASSVARQRLQFRYIQNERDLVQYVATVGPAVTIFKMLNSFYSYGGGVYDDPACPTDFRHDVDHAVVIVGYGTENGVDYWLIKNTWGTQWALGGYAKFRRNKNACSIGWYNWIVLG